MNLENNLLSEGNTKGYILYDILGKIMKTVKKTSGFHSLSEKYGMNKQNTENS